MIIAYCVEYAFSLTTKKNTEWKMNNVRDNIFDEDYLRKYHFYQLMMLYLHKHNGDCPYLKNNVRFQLHTMRF